MNKEIWIKDVFAVDCEYGVSGRCKAYRGIDKEGYRNCLLIGQVEDMYFCPKLHYSKEECMKWYKRERELEVKYSKELEDQTKFKTLKQYIEEQMKNPEFAQAYEEIQSKKYSLLL